MTTLADGHRAIVITDDAGSMRERMIDVLRGAGCTVEVAVNGRVAVELLSGGAPADLILYDADHAVPYGGDLVSILLCTERSRHIPVVVVTREIATERLRDSVVGYLRARPARR